MSLPTGFLDEIKSRLTLSDLVGRKVSWDLRKSNQAKGDYWAPCPFHQEKTASFHVDNQKGYYYCFGCHAKGDAIGFVKETENLSFMEAVQRLAEMAGLSLPAPDPAARAAQDEHARLSTIMEGALRFYRRTLAQSRGAEARDYLAGRGLCAKIIAEFELGYAPRGAYGGGAGQSSTSSAETLTQHLRAQGVALTDLELCGLTITPDTGAPFDRFRDRIIFPIKDPRGRCIAFGGRAMSAQAKAKYLNSPETPLFDKGRTLYHYGPAREAVGKGQPLILAEGYMDVIALVAAGFTGAVAPLGTAITEAQLRLAWRISPDPVLALDGDAAGQRAAYRALDLALPHITATQSLRFCMMPEGVDPDDLLRRDGPKAMQERLGSALPLAQLLWQRAIEEAPLETPEARAGFDAKIRQILAQIQDRDLQRHYRESFRAWRRDLFQPARRAAPPMQRTGGPSSPRGGARAFERPQAQTKRSTLAQTQTAGIELREAILLLAAYEAPEAALKEEDRFAALNFTLGAHEKLHRAILETLPLYAKSEDKRRSQEAIIEIMQKDIAAELRRNPSVAAHPYLGRAAAAQSAPAWRLAQCLEEEILKCEALSATEQELEEAQTALQNAGEDSHLTYRLQQASEARTRALRGFGTQDRAEEDPESGLSERLKQLIEQKIWLKEKKKHH